MADLFASDETDGATADAAPLADRLRPRTLGEVVGQEHLTGPDGTIGRLLGQVHAEVWMRGDTVVSSALVESPPAPVPAGYMPGHIEAYRSAIQRSLELPRTVPHVAS